MLTKGIVPLFVTFAFINSLWTEKNFHSIFLWQVKKKKIFFLLSHFKEIKMSLLNTTTTTKKESESENMERFQ